MTVQPPRTPTGDPVADALYPLVGELEQLAAGEPSFDDAERVVGAIAALLPDERPADLLDEIAQADVPAALRAAAARHLIAASLVTLQDDVVRRMLAEVGPPARLALARGLHERGDHDLARGLVQPLMRAVHDDIRHQARLLYRYSPDEYAGMALPDLLRDALDEPGWLHRAWAARELLRRGEVDAALKALDAVVGAWTYFRDDPECIGEPLRVVRALGQVRDDPRAAALLDRAADDPDPAIRQAAHDARRGRVPDIDLTADAP
jgi:hypothetical protein